MQIFSRLAQDYFSRKPIALVDNNGIIEAQEKARKKNGKPYRPEYCG
jgi:hypothetical protein